jgi:phosphonate transport system substrate-binding protein
MNRGLSLRSLTLMISVLVILSLVLTACGTSPTPPPTAVPTAKPVAPTAAPVAPTAVPAAPTAAPTAAATVAPTKAPAAPTVAVPVAKCEKMATALSPKAGELGAADKPIVITFVPSVDTGLITKGGTAMADCLSKMTGLAFKIEVGTSEAASIEALGGGKAQMAFLNTFAILLAKQKYDVDVALVAQRKYGPLDAAGNYFAFPFDPDKDLAGKLTSYYKPEYYTKAGSGIKALTDLKGKSFCFTSASSTSGGIIPRATFKALGIDPDKDMKSTYAGGHDKAAIAVYQGDCDAGVAFMDVLTDKATNLASKFPDIATKVTVFALGDRIPNDGLQFIKGLDPKIRAIAVDALMAMMADPGGNAVVKSIYNYDAFEKADYTVYYAPFEAMLKKAGVDVATLVKQ